jgi:hypothetical protein
MDVSRTFLVHEISVASEAHSLRSGGGRAFDNVYIRIFVREIQTGYDVYFILEPVRESPEAHDLNYFRLVYHSISE